MRKGAVLAESFVLRSNALNSIRIALAFTAIVVHSFAIGGFGVPPMIGDLDPFDALLGCFFVASGYLICESRSRTNLSRFGWARFVRIYPAFWVCLIVTAFVFAPIAGLVAGGWTVRDGLSYVVQNFSLNIGQFGIGHTLPHAYWPAWNGSLWTLKFEFAFYVFMGLFLSVRRFRGGWWLASVFMLATGVSVLRHIGFLDRVGTELSGPFLGLELSNWSMLGSYFFAGALLHRYKRSISMSPALFTIAGTVTVASIWAGWGAVISPLPVAYCTMWLATKLPRVVERIGDGTFDISYGTYIYAFPIQQLLVLAGVHRLGVIPMIFASIAVTMVPALLSWYLIEKRCMRLKSVSWPRRWPSKRRPEVDVRAESTGVAVAEPV